MRLNFRVRKKRGVQLSALLANAHLMLAALLMGCSPFNPVTVSQILEMTREGDPPAVIIGKMKESNTVYRLHAHQIVQLHKDGVNDEVLDYMQHTYLDAVRRDQSLADWDNYALGQDGFFYGGDPVGWAPGWK